MNAVDKNIVLLSSANSTSAILAANQQYIGISQNVDVFPQIIVTYISDVPSTTNGISLQFSDDMETWNTKLEYTTVYNKITKQYNSSIVAWVPNRYFRLVYTNGPSDQKYFQLQCSFKKYRDPDLLPDALSSITKEQSSQCIRFASEYKRDVALGLVSFNSNFIVNAVREQGIGLEEEYLVSLNGYIFPQVARKIRIKKDGDPNDIFGGEGAWSIWVSGLDQEFNTISEILLTNGKNPSQWSNNSYLRINSTSVYQTGEYSGYNYGNIVLENEIDNLEIGIVWEKHGRSLSSIYTVPKGYSVVIPRIAFICDSEHSATFTGWFRTNKNCCGALAASNAHTPPYEPSKIINFVHGLRGCWETKPEELICFGEGTDFWITVRKVVGDGMAMVSASYDIDLLQML